eukprot:gb/GFBE01030901.1/.p1 GENE.gb/GFBE01030901.1/~~gb/GFBE01030901.1/.p1  ORF type:complete len:336 (+),score=46.84 gb/GFBE01030901.1/:1-1008(+)
MSGFSFSIGFLLIPRAATFEISRWGSDVWNSEDPCSFGASGCSTQLLQQDVLRKQRGGRDADDEPLSPSWVDDVFADIVGKYYSQEPWMDHWRKFIRKNKWSFWIPGFWDCSADPIPETCGQPFNCSVDPAMCQSPYNCQHAPRTWLEFIAKVYTDRSETGSSVNLQAECYLDQQAWPWMRMCHDGNLVAAAHKRHEVSKLGTWKVGKERYYTEASECFIEGHCLNSAVTNSTTGEEADRMCVDRYGDYTANMVATGLLTHIDREARVETGMTGINQTAPAGWMSCIENEYHCFVMYCKETHCQDPEMIQKFSHLQDDFGWTIPSPKTEAWWFRR